MTQNLETYFNPAWSNDDPFNRTVSKTAVRVPFQHEELDCRDAVQ
jgi:hypothetical protein